MSEHNISGPRVFSPTSLADAARAWVRPLRPPPQATLRLYCLPFAGGGLSAFSNWPKELAPRIEVCPVRLPGRESRFSEPAFTRTEPLIAELAQIVAYESERPKALPFAIFGQSMGATLAFELCHRLRETTRAEATRLLVACRPAPPVPTRLEPVYHLDDDAFIEAMSKRYQAIPDEVLKQPELLELVLPPLRSDMELIDHWRYVERTPLDMPLTVLGGREDSSVPLEDLEVWRTLTRAESTVDVLDGGHFVIQEDPRAALAVVRAALS
ncbi:MAG: alpha/beta fold hydrolase [Myxococcota bacterium]